MTQEDMIFMTGVMIATFLIAIVVTKLMEVKEEKQIGISIPTPKPEEKKEIRTFTNIPKEKAGPIRRPSADDLEMRQRSKEEKETSEEWKKKLDPLTPKK